MALNLTQQLTGKVALVTGKLGTSRVALCILMYHAQIRGFAYVLQVQHVSMVLLIIMHGSELVAALPHESIDTAFRICIKSL